MIEYREVPGFPDYRVGNDGSLWSKRPCKWPAAKFETDGPWRKLRFGYDKDGYALVNLISASGQKKTTRVHRCVLLTFVGSCPSGMEGCHRNGNKTDNVLDNLYWATPKQNANDRERHGNTARGERHGRRLLTDNQVREIRAAAKKAGRHGKWGAKYFAARFRVSYATIVAANNNHWRHLDV